MKFLASILLAAVLLMQAGQGMSLMRRVAEHDVSCAYGCCSDGGSCCCIEAPASVPEPQSPASLPVSGRAPQPLMTLVAANELPALTVGASDGAAFHRVAPRSIAASAVPLTVLHCAFLI